MRYVQLAIQRIWMFPIGGTDIGFIARWTMRRVFLVLGAVIFALGVVIAPLPIPLGVPLMLLGAVIVVNSSVTAKRLFLRWLRRRPGVTRRLRLIIGRSRRRRAARRAMRELS